jgi:hypothetical protein
MAVNKAALTAFIIRPNSVEPSDLELIISSAPSKDNGDAFSVSDRISPAIPPLPCAAGCGALSGKEISVGRGVSTGDGFTTHEERSSRRIAGNNFIFDYNPIPLPCQ